MEFPALFRVLREGSQLLLVSGVLSYNTLRHVLAFVEDTVEKPVRKAVQCPCICDDVFIEVTAETRQPDPSQSQSLARNKVATAVVGGAYSGCYETIVEATVRHICQAVDQHRAYLHLLLLLSDAS